MSEKPTLTNIFNLEPWNTEKVTINNIRYNQNYSLFTLATSRGYKIFSTETLQQYQSETQTVRDLDNLEIAMNYYESSLVFFLAAKSNPNFSQKELIIFNDKTQNNDALIKSKDEDILNFYISKHLIYVVVKSKITIIEFSNLKIFKVINNIITDEKLYCFNCNDTCAYSFLDDKNKIQLFKIITSRSHSITSVNDKCITTNFESIQIINISKNNKYIGIVSILGNKIHIYDFQSLSLVECMFISNEINTINNFVFSLKENYVFIGTTNKIMIVKILKNEDKEIKCNCDKHSDQNIIEQNKKEVENKYYGFMKYVKKLSSSIIKNNNKEMHLIMENKEKNKFINFDGFKNKDIICIDDNGKYKKYRFKKTKTKEISTIVDIQWE